MIMDLEVENRKLETILITIESKHRVTRLPMGILSIKAPYEFKGQLQKVFKRILPHYQEYLEDLKALEKDFADQVDEKEKAIINEKIKALGEKKVNVSFEPVSLKIILSMETQENWDTDIVELFAK